MAGTRTAPAINGTPSFKTVSIRWIDYTGNLRSDNYQLPAAATDAQVEALVAALQAGSNASIYRVDVNFAYYSVEDSSNANEVVWEDVKDNLVIQAKNTLADSEQMYVPAPSNDMFIEGTENIDPTNTELAAILTATLAAFGAGYGIVGARLSKRTRRGKQTKI